MAFDKMTEQIEKVKEDREQFRLATLNVLSQYERDHRRFYALAALVTAIFASVSIAYTHSATNISLYKLSTILLVITSIVSIAQFINLLEKQSKKFYTNYHDILEKQNRELYVLEKFKYGYIDTDEIRKYYTEQARTLDKFDRPQKLSMTLSWIIFILFSISLILFVLSI